MENRILPGLAMFDPIANPEMPEITSEYQDSISRIILLQRDGVTHFYGGKLDLSGDRNVWMCPVEVDDGDNYTYFQVLYVNTTPEETIGSKDIPVSILEIDEASFKLADNNHPGYQQLQKLLNGSRKLHLRKSYNIYAIKAKYERGVSMLRVRF